MVRSWRFFASFLRPVFPASRVQHISDLHSKFALGPHQSAAAEIRRGINENRKKIEDRKKPQGKDIMSASATQGGHNNTASAPVEGEREPSDGERER